MNNYIFLIVGPSGSGKSTIVEQLVETMNLKQIESYTTRKPRSRHEKGHIINQISIEFIVNHTVYENLPTPPVNQFSDLCSGHGRIPPE